MAAGLSLAVALGIPSAALAQTPPPVFATGVEVVAVDVSVVDKDGRPVPDLLAEDFNLSVGGRPRRIVSVDFVKEPDRAAKAGEPAAASPVPAAYSTNENARPGRLILIAVDQGNIQMGTGRGTIRAATKLLDRLSPTDKVGLVAIPAPGPRVEFTTDHASVREALRSLVGRGRLGGHGVSLTEALAAEDDPDKWNEALRRECGGPGGPCASMLVTEAAAIRSSYRHQSRTSIDMLRSLFDVMKSIDAPKTLVLITQGLGEPQSGSRAGYGYVGDIRPLADQAAAARVALFAVTVNEAGLIGADGTLPAGATAEDQYLHEFGLETLADIARGVVLRGTPELAFERIAREISGHYLLGFEPEAGERDGKNHKLAVKVTRSGATVRTWRSVSLPSASPRQQEQSLAASLRAPQLATDVPVRVASYAMPDAAGRKVRVLAVAELGYPSASGSLDVAYVLVDANDHVVASAVHTVQPTKDASTQGARVPFAASLLVDPGLYTLKLAARDRLGKTGRVDHPVRATIAATPGGEIETGDLFFGPLPAPGAAFRPAVGEVSPGPVVVRWDVFARDPGFLKGGEAVAEIAAIETGPVRGAVPARLVSSDAPGHGVVQAVLQLQDLLPGDYVLRVRLSIAGQPPATVVRPIRLEATRTSDAKDP